MLRLLKSESDTRDIPVIVVSAYATLMDDPDRKLVAREIQKPFDHDDLIGQVAAVVRRSPGHVELC